MKMGEIINKACELAEEVYEVVVDGFAKQRRRYFNIATFTDNSENKNRRAETDDGSVSGSW